MNAKSGRVKFEFAYADDNSKPAVAGTEARRLVGQESVDVLFGLTSSANGARDDVADATSSARSCSSSGRKTRRSPATKAGKLVYRFSPNNRMMLKTLATRVLALGKKLVLHPGGLRVRQGRVQRALGDPRARGRHRGRPRRRRRSARATSRPNLTKARNSGADVLMLANSGLDAANACKQFVDFGLGKKMKLAGINLEDFYYKAVPLDAIAGTTFPVAWTPTCSRCRPPAHRAAARRTSTRRSRGGTSSATSARCR